ncbi:UNKNOWN [Stylonychia lemnae]|uniref:Uncharacterized protein n=1 Tax=Stylonychia lemnae TaxID=5949 RepID=A0A077ZU63_STYLE|nr:UNKNOWN [Stylonychia lemnae]|eukprot:CDW73448.1 UNKNOWN [Stylonychia lemnae]
MKVKHITEENKHLINSQTDTKETIAAITANASNTCGLTTPQTSVQSSADKKGRGRPDPNSNLFMYTPEKAGGPTDIMTGFHEMAKLILGERLSDTSLHPMHSIMSLFSFTVTPSGLDNEVAEQGAQKAKQLRKTFHDVTKDIRIYPEGKKNMLNCEQIFTLYLREFSFITNPSYYTNTLLKFILMFRQCLNIYGWQKRAEYEIKQHYGTPEYHQKYQLKMQNFQQFGIHSDFTAINNCEFAPEIANEFVTVFLDDPGNNMARLERADGIDLTQHFCNWLFINKLTCSKLSMAQ